MRGKNEGSFYAGPQLRALRKQLCLSRRAFAEELEISPTLVTYMEGNKRRITKEMLARLMEKYNVSDEYFTAFEEETCHTKKSAIRLI